MVNQMNYFRNADLGFDKESIVNVPIPNDSLSQTKLEWVHHQLLQQSGIRDVSFSTFTPLDNDIWNNYFKFDHSSKKMEFLAYL